jgi:protein tyrosine phosphatase (PTP) superfamily phosphohydrolase (DUF442 family)
MWTAVSIAVPDAVPLSSRLWVLKTAPTAQTYASLKAAGITHVVSLRRDGEAGFNPEMEGVELTRLEVQFVRVAMGRAPTREDFDIFRMMLRDLPRGSRVLVHCGDGNRAAAAVCAYLVAEERRPLEDTVARAREAGLALPETERALRSYLSLSGV